MAGVVQKLAKWVNSSLRLRFPAERGEIPGVVVFERGRAQKPPHEKVPRPGSGEFFKAGKIGASPRFYPPSGFPLPDFGKGGRGMGSFW